MNRSPRLARNLSLAATLTSLLISSTLAADTKSPGQSSRRTGKLPVPGKPPTGGKPGQGFTPLSLPDSLAGDFHAAWALRARVARAYWPQWLEKPTAPIFVRSRPFDFFINDSDPALPATSPRDIPGGGGFFQGSLEKTLPPAEPGMRIEAQGAKWLVLLDAQGGRGGTRSDLAALIAYRDFLVYETMIAKPVFFTADDNKRVADLRINRDLVAWIDSEAVALRRAVAAGDEVTRARFAAKALGAWEKAELTVAHSKEMQQLLDWVQDTRRYEGTAQYLRVLLQSEARAVAAGDTARALPAEGSGFEARARPWRKRVLAGSDQQLMGAHMGSIAEVGAFYCLLLDDWSPEWRKHVYDSDFRFPEALEKALAKRGNSSRSRG